ncbi:MAG TPA: signal peptidase II [Candidatus Babeliales bacterium]|nr:signal peptidase II [Candidatus Babeliales bacterium]
MKKKWLLFAYVLVGLLLLVLDRVSKHWAIVQCADGWEINSFLSCDLTYNRGISWSLFASHDATAFTILCLFISLIIMLVAMHAYFRCNNNRTIWGEVCVIAGAASNLLDRIVYTGVVDFVHVRAGGYSWPIFNGADVFIVVGVAIIFLTNYWDDTE